MNILSLPTEIHEKILGNLEIADLMSAVQTCQLWKQIANSRHLKSWCLQNISSEVLSEITSDFNISHGEEVDWVKICKKWSKTIDTSEDIEARPALVLTKSACVTVSGDVILAGDVPNNLTWFDFRGNQLAKKSFNNLITCIGLLSLTNHGEVFKMNPLQPDSLYLQHDAVIVLGHTFVGIYSMPTWKCQELFYMQEEHIAASVSVQGKRFAYYNNADNVIRVCAITVLEEVPWQSAQLPKLTNFKWQIKVVPVCHILATANVQNWKLWKNSVICLQNNGTVVIWNAHNGKKAHRSNIISEMLYPFESFLYRHLIFCNVNIARAMLKFWHINMGSPHWLVSNDGITFNRMNTYLEFGEEIKSIVIQRTAVVTGTSSGRICIYRHTGSDSDIAETITRGPIAVYRIGHDALHKCHLSLDGSYFLVILQSSQNLVSILKLPVTEKYA